MSKAPIVPFKTPAGELKWVMVTGEGKANQSGKMKYCADLVLPEESEEAKKLMAMLDEFWKDNKPGRYPAKTKGYRQETRPVLDENGEKQYDEEDRVITEPTGNVVFPFQTDTTWAKSGDPKLVQIYNAKGSKVSLGDKKIGNGSIGNIGGAMGIYAVKDESGKITSTGVTLYLNSIRILKLVEYNNEDNWDDAGVDDGWTGEDNWDSEPTDTPPPRL